MSRGRPKKKQRYLFGSNSNDTEWQPKERWQQNWRKRSADQLIQHTCMNETLYRWTFNFHKVVRQQNSGAVPYSVVYLRIQKWKNYWNPSTFAKVIVKIKGARFYGPRCRLTFFIQKTLQIAVCRTAFMKTHFSFSFSCNHFSGCLFCRL